MNLLVPARRRGVEILDDPSCDSALAVRSLHDVAKANRLFGGTRAVLRTIVEVLPADVNSFSLLDVGTGIGDIPSAARRAMQQRNITVTTIGVELDATIAKAAANSGTRSVVASGLELPFATASVDVVTCSQVLHHFDERDSATVLQECSRVARLAVIIGDLRRSWLAVAGLWASSFMLGFHPVSRHDGIVSILRGYTTTDLERIVEQSTGCRSKVSRRLGWRVTASWSPRSNSGAPKSNA